VGASLVIRKEVFDKISFHNKNIGEDSQFLKDCNENGISIYSSDIYNFITIRNKNINNYTWKIDDSKFTAKAKFICNGLATELSSI